MHSIRRHSRRMASLKGTHAVAGFAILDFSRWSQHRESGRNIKSNLTREIQYRIIRKKSKIQLLMHGNTFCAPYYAPFYIRLQLPPISPPPFSQSHENIHNSIFNLRVGIPDGTVYRTIFQPPPPLPQLLFRHASRIIKCTKKYWLLTWQAG